MGGHSRFQILSVLLLSACAIAPTWAHAEYPVHCKSYNRMVVGNEAVAVASNLLRSVDSQSDNKTLGVDWLINFTNCLSIAGVHNVNEITINKGRLVRLVVRTMADELLRLQSKNAPAKIQDAVANYQQLLNAVFKLDPDFSRPEILAKINLAPRFAGTLVKDHAVEGDDVQASCSTIDYSDRLGEVRDQGDIGWCYSYVAAELATYRIMKQNGTLDWKKNETDLFAKISEAGVSPLPRPQANPTARVSAFDLAFQYNKHFYRDNSEVWGIDNYEQQGGWVEKALQSAILEGGFCPEASAPSQNFRYGSNVSSLREIELYKRAMSTNSDVQNFEFTRIRQVFPNVGFEQFVSILSKPFDSDNDYFDQLTKANCSTQRRQFFKAQSIHDFEIDASREQSTSMVQKIDGQLENGNVIGISFETGMILPKGGSGHALTVVGRKYNPESKSCRFLLRNQWGASACDTYLPGMCAKDHPGHLWVSRERLGQYLWHLTYIEP